MGKKIWNFFSTSAVEFNLKIGYFCQLIEPDDALWRHAHCAPTFSTYVLNMWYKGIRREQTRKLAREQQITPRFWILCTENEANFWPIFAKSRFFNMFVQFFVKWHTRTHFICIWIKLEQNIVEKSAKKAFWPPAPHFRNTVIGL